MQFFIKVTRMAKHKREELEKKVWATKQNVAEVQGVEEKAKASLQKVDQEICTLKGRVEPAKKWAKEAEAWVEALQNIEVQWEGKLQVVKDKVIKAFCSSIKY